MSFFSEQLQKAQPSIDKISQALNAYRQQKLQQAMYDRLYPLVKKWSEGNQVQETVPGQTSIMPGQPAVQTSPQTVKMNVPPNLTQPVAPQMASSPSQTITRNEPPPNDYAGILNSFVQGGASPAQGFSDILGLRQQDIQNEARQATLGLTAEERRSSDWYRRNMVALREAELNKQGAGAATKQTKYTAQVGGVPHNMMAVYDSKGQLVRTDDLGPAATTVESGKDLPNVNWDVTGDAFLKQFSRPDQNLIKSYDNYTTNPDTAPTRLFRGQKGYSKQQMVALVKQYDPTYDETQWGGRKKYIMDLTGGNLNKRVVSLNQSLTHIGTLKQASDNIDKILTSSSGWGPFTKTYNSIGAWAADHSGDPRVTSFKTAAERVADEVAAFYKGGNASATDIGQEKEKALNEIYNAPAQKGAFLNTTLQLLGGAVASAREDYEARMGKSAPPNTFLFPTAQRILQGLQRQDAQFDMGEFTGSGVQSQQQPQQQGQQANNDPLGIR